MATRVTVRGTVGPRGARAAQAAVEAALAVFPAVERACTRFDPNSPLMQANASPEQWHAVPPECFSALRAAYDAYRLTGGRFDPRVLADLVRLGYDRSMAEAAPNVFPARPRGVGPTAYELSRPPLEDWRPEFRDASGEVLLGRHPVDLGGIGKGLAVRWAAERLAEGCAGGIVEAGGDCYCAGVAPEGGRWRVAVEDPGGGTRPVAVLAVSDAACATSSVRVRHWRRGDRTVHHLLDPRDGQPGGAGLAAVTVVGPDPAIAEVWSKTLFLAGAAGIAATAARVDAVALWVTVDGRVGLTDAMRPYVIWPTMTPVGTAPPPASSTTPAPATPAPATTPKPTRPDSVGPGPTESDDAAPPAGGRLLGTAAATAVVIGAGILAAVLTAPLAHAAMLPWILGRGLGLAAYLALTALVGSGFWQRHPWRQRFGRPSPAGSLRLHAFLAAAVAVLVAGHVGVLALDRFAGVGWVGAFWPGHAAYRPLAVALGTVGLYLGALVGGTAALAGRLTGRFWRPVHWLATAAFALVWVHAVLAGSDTAALRGVYLVTGGIVTLLAITRRLARRRHVVAPPQRSSGLPERVGAS